MACGDVLLEGAAGGAAGGAARVAIRRRDLDALTSCAGTAYVAHIASSSGSMPSHFRDEDLDTEPSSLIDEHDLIAVGVLFQGFSRRGEVGVSISRSSEEVPQDWTTALLLQCL